MKIKHLVGISVSIAVVLAGAAHSSSAGGTEIMTVPKSQVMSGLDIASSLVPEGSWGKYKTLASACESHTRWHWQVTTSKDFTPLEVITAVRNTERDQLFAAMALVSWNRVLMDLAIRISTYGQTEAEKIGLSPEADQAMRTLLQACDSQRQKELTSDLPTIISVHSNLKRMLPHNHPEVHVLYGLTNDQLKAVQKLIKLQNEYKFLKSLESIIEALDEFKVKKDEPMTEVSGGSQASAEPEAEIEYLVNYQTILTALMHQSGKPTKDEKTALGTLISHPTLEPKGLKERNKKLAETLNGRIAGVGWGDFIVTYFQQMKENLSITNSDMVLLIDQLSRFNEVSKQNEMVAGLWKVVRTYGWLMRQHSGKVPSAIQFALLPKDDLTHLANLAWIYHEASVFKNLKASVTKRAEAWREAHMRQYLPPTVALPAVTSGDKGKEEEK